MSNHEALPGRISATSLTARWTAPPLGEIFVGIAVFAAACISFWLTKAPTGIALFWPGTAIAAAALIRLPQVRWSVAILSVLLATYWANILVGHRPWDSAALFVLINGAETALMVLTFRFLWPLPYPDISIKQSGVMVALFGVTIPGLAAVVAGAVLHEQFSVSFVQGTLQWWSSHAIGACLLAPPIILFSLKELKRLTRGRFLIENAVIFLAGLCGCYLAIRYVRFPFVSIGLLLLFAAFRLGGLGASLLSVCFGLLITNLWLLGVRPLGLDPSASASTSLVDMPVVALLASLLPPIAVGLGSDARRAAVRDLRISERRFRESMERSPIGMLISDLNGVWNYTNIALQKMLGYSAEEFRALPPGGPSSPEDWQESHGRWGRLLTGEIDFYDVMRRFQHKNGRWIWTHVAISLMRNEDGSPLHLIAQIESLQARQLAEEKLADERERLRITLASINDAVITTDAQTRITYLNVAAETLLAVNLQAVQTRRIDEVVHLVDPKSSQIVTNLVALSAQHGKVIKRDQACLLRRADGSVCYVMDTVSPVVDATGSVTGMVIVLRDSTLEVQRSNDLQFRALHDPLTGLSNRTEFEHELILVFKAARQLNRPAALIAIDLDRFKALNDAAGHAAGDAMLRQVADTCRANVRASDTVARLGGDEFGIILGTCTEERALRISNQLVKALNGLEIDWLGSHYTVGASAGLAMCTMEMIDEKAWLRAADDACYAAKRQGRGRLLLAAGMRDNVVALKKS